MKQKGLKKRATIRSTSQDANMFLCQGVILSGFFFIPIIPCLGQLRVHSTKCVVRGCLYLGENHEREGNMQMVEEAAADCTYLIKQGLPLLRHEREKSSNK